MSPSDAMIKSEQSAASVEEMSALALTREAIARWTGGQPPAAPLARDTPRVSPQARWLDQAQRNLAQWIACGGFAQGEGAAAPLPALMRPTMYRPAALTSLTHG